MRRKRRSWRRSTGGGDTFHFFYDASGKRTSLDYNGETYVYLYNAQGDVAALSDTNGNVVVEYTYDAWGNPLSVTGTGATTIGQKNPFRYRGYFYDIETGLYYLQSRYYSPKVGRFVCADGYITTGQYSAKHNAFTYCNNNPERYIDDNGCVPDEILLRNAARYRNGGNVLMCGYANNQKKVDITRKLNTEMKKNTALLAQNAIENRYMPALTILYFVDHVRPGGEWDFKSREDWGLRSDTIYLYNGLKLRFDDIGNIHYGYVGRVLFSREQLLVAGGAVQILAGTSEWAYWKSNFDDPRDQWAIRYGSDLWDWEVGQ